MTVAELIAELQKIEDKTLEVAVPKFEYPEDKYVGPCVRVEEMVLSGGHWTARVIRPGAKESRGMAVTLG